MDIDEAKARTVGEVIDKAIEENRSGQWLLYLLASALAVVGIAVLVYAVT